MSGLVIESATEHAEVAVFSSEGTLLAHEMEAIGHGHTRMLTPLVRRALTFAKIAPRQLAWIATDLGPGSFTGVRVGLATAQGFALAGGAQLLGASSLAALAHASPARKALVVPLVGAGRRDLYAGFFRADVRGQVRVLAAPRVGTVQVLLAAAREAHALVPDHMVRFVGPGAGRERAALEAAFPLSCALAFRHDGLSALDLITASRLRLGPPGGLPSPGASLEPLYVRSAQAEETVRRRALLATPITIRTLTFDDVDALAEIEKRVFADPWSASFFRSEIIQEGAWVRAAERGGRLAGYALTIFRAGSGQLDNLATLPELRRHGVARALLEDVMAHARSIGAHELTLEVRVSNDAAQQLYRTHGFRLASLRRGYYRDNGEDAVVMKWDVSPPPAPTS